ncbi:hypothetical protein [Polaribacter sp.]|uniref:hypothetical protein n=1 Tax=Polaribacter sp. TaxID=1920175 RepID=UPI003EF3FA55
MKSIYKILLVIFFLPFVAFANKSEKKHEKNLIIKKEFHVNADAKVSLNNRYGNLHITTWDKNKIAMEITITVNGDDLDAVEDKLSNIRVNFNANASFVEATTIFEDKGSNWSWWKKSKNINYKINYVVKMPKTNSVELDNDYGSIYLDNLSGKADVKCDYGKIIVGELLAENNSISLDYCSASSIGYMKSGDLNIDYSKINIDAADKVRVKADYSTLKFDKIDTIDFNSDYGSLIINNANTIKGSSDYVNMRFGTVKKNISIRTDYGNILVKNLAKGFENVEITGQYAGIKIGVATGAVFNFQVDLQYAGFNRNDEKIAFYKSLSKATKKYYEGKFGKGNAEGNIKIKSEYGSVSISENN